MVFLAMTAVQKAISAVVFDFLWISALSVLVTRIFYDQYGLLKPKWEKYKKCWWAILLMVILFPAFVLIQLVRSFYYLVALTKINHKVKKEESLDFFSNYKNYNKIYNLPQRKTSQKKHIYTSKSLMTNCEKRYYDIIKNTLKDGYKLQPQIPLSSIINKKNNNKTPLELYRTIDFAILNEDNEIVCLIEINDRTHYLEKRVERDKKVQDILNDASIPLATLWTDQGISRDYIEGEIKRAIRSVKTV